MNCKHKNIEAGYGYLPKFRGLGIYSYCNDCGKTISWLDDKQCNSEKEIEHNKNICEENEIKYGGL